MTPTGERRYAALETASTIALLGIIALAAATLVGSSLASRQLGVTANREWKPVMKTINNVQMVLVPAGCFMMGSYGGQDDEKPVNQQCFPKPFWIDRTEVTIGQFSRFSNQLFFLHWNGNNQPREQVSWQLARDHCAGRGARLPTEAEWEYTARGPDDLKYPWGNVFDPAKAVFMGNNDHGIPPEVGSIPAGASWVGALDMSGSLAEWVNSLYRPYPYNAADGRENTTISNRDDQHVVRGGGWFDTVFSLNLANRNASIADNGFGYFGFRCARDSYSMDFEN